MNLPAVRKSLGFENGIPMNTVKSAEGEITPWMKHWDNDNRVAILIHKDTLAKIKENPDTHSLGINVQMKEGEKGPYTAKTIVMYNEQAEEIL